MDLGRNLKGDAGKKMFYDHQTGKWAENRLSDAEFS